jgi:Protein of unknown function (DUF3592)
MARKKYSIDWENGEAVAFEVDGLRYDSLADVPGEQDRDRLSAMAAAGDGDLEEAKLSAKELEELRKDAADQNASDQGMEKIVVGIFTLVSILMIAATVVSAFFNIQKASTRQSTPGHVVDVVIRREYINEKDRITRDFYYPVIEFTALDGRARSVQLNEGSDTPYYEKGDAVIVSYDPAHPLDARIKSASSNAVMWILPAVTGILGIAFAGAVFIVKKVMAA